VSDTPKTDAAYDAVRAFTNEEQAVDALIELRDTSRKLERENAALREQVEHLIGMIEQLESDLAHFATVEAFEGKKEAHP
jgi:predicted RNase H-like nuclease (RuvC/YqgF family)